MFDNIGSKIKGLAEVVTWIGIILSVIGGIAIMCIDEEMIFPGFLVIIAGSLASWLSSLTLYGFGHLIENSDILVEQGKNRPTNQSNTYATNNTASHQWRCDKCGNMISEKPCPICSKKDSE